MIILYYSLPIIYCRAKKYLFLTYASRRLYFGKNNYNEISRFLEDIPEDLIQKEEDEFDLSNDDWDEEW